jgi:NAD+ diphosphatase
MLQTPPHFVARSDAQLERSATVHAFVFRAAEVLVREDGAMPDALAIDLLAHLLSEQHFVGELNGVAYAVQHVPKDTPAPPGYAFKGLRALWGTWDDALVAVGGRAFQIQDWARTHRYCGVCATPTERMAGERGIKCPNCGYSAYPRISPSMMVLIQNGPKILLARNVAFPPNRFSALAGFLEVGESAEDAVHREVYEEVGLKVSNLRYFASQSWPFPHSLMIAFTADYAGGEIVTDPSEIAEARWLGPGDDLPDLPPRVSIARALIDSVITRW